MEFFKPRNVKKQIGKVCPLQVSNILEYYIFIPGALDTIAWCSDWKGASIYIMITNTMAL